MYIRTLLVTAAIAFAFALPLNTAAKDTASDAPHAVAEAEINDVLYELYAVDCTDGEGYTAARGMKRDGRMELTLGCWVESGKTGVFITWPGESDVQSIDWSQFHLLDKGK